MGALLAPGTGQGFGAQLSPEILAQILAALQASGAQGAGSSPIVPSIPENQGPGLAPGAPTPGAGGSSGIGAGLGGGIGAAFGGPVGAGIGSALGGLGEALLSGGGKESDSTRAGNFARVGATNAQGAATNSRALQQLMQILLQGRTGRGG